MFKFKNHPIVYDFKDTPMVGAIYVHMTKGTRYMVYDITNHCSERLDEYPVRVSYVRLCDRTRWSRSKNDWKRSYLPADTITFKEWIRNSF